MAARFITNPRRNPAPRYVLLGVDDEVQVCDDCGKADLKCTVVLGVLDADGNVDHEVRFGRDCAAKALRKPRTVTAAKMEKLAREAAYNRVRAMTVGAPSRVKVEGGRFPTYYFTYPLTDGRTLLLQESDPSFRPPAGSWSRLREGAWVGHPAKGNPRRPSAKHIVSGEYDSTETSASYRYGAKVLKALRAAGVPATARYATSSAYGPWHIVVPASHEDHAEAVVAPLHAAHAKAFQRTVRKMVKGRKKNPGALATLGLMGGAFVGGMFAERKLGYAARAQDYVSRARKRDEKPTPAPVVARTGTDPKWSVEEEMGGKGLLHTRRIAGLEYSVFERIYGNGDKVVILDVFDASGKNPRRIPGGEGSDGEEWKSVAAAKAAAEKAGGLKKARKKNPARRNPSDEDDFDEDYWDEQLQEMCETTDYSLLQEGDDIGHFDRYGGRGYHETSPERAESIKKEGLGHHPGLAYPGGGGIEGHESNLWMCAWADPSVATRLLARGRKDNWRWDVADRIADDLSKHLVQKFPDLKVVWFYKDAKGKGLSKYAGTKCSFDLRKTVEWLAANAEDGPYLYGDEYMGYCLSWRGPRIPPKFLRWEKKNPARRSR